MGRTQGRPQRGGRGRGFSNRRSGRNNGQGRNSKPNSTAPKTKKTLSDHIFHVGSAKQASDYVTNKKFFINYVKKTYENGDDVGEALEKKEDVTIERPVLQIGTNDAENLQFLEEWKIKYKTYNDRLTQYERTKNRACAVLWDQCSSTMKSKICSRKDYETDIEGNLINMMQAIKQHCERDSIVQWRKRRDRERAS